MIFEIATKSRKIVSNDLAFINRHLNALKGKVRKFKIATGTDDFIMDWDKGEMRINGEIVSKIESLSAFEIINFRRHIIDYSMNGVVREMVFHIFGWKDPKRQVGCLIVIDELTNRYVVVNYE